MAQQTVTKVPLSCDTAELTYLLLFCKDFTGSLDCRDTFLINIPIWSALNPLSLLRTCSRFSKNIFTVTSLKFIIL